MRTARLHHITQFEYGKTRAWWVRIYLSSPRRKRRPTKPGKARQNPKRPLVASKLFSYAVHGSKTKALAAAIRWRDTELPKHSKTPRPYGKGFKRPPGTGYIARRWRIRVHKRTGKRTRYLVWHAWIRLHEGKAAETTYSIAKWGEEGARLLVQSWFSQKVRECKRRKR